MPQWTEDSFYAHIAEFNPLGSVNLIIEFVQRIDRESFFTEYGFGSVQASLNIRLASTNRIYFGLMSTPEGFKAWYHNDDYSGKYTWIEGSVVEILNYIQSNLLGNSL